MEDRLQIVVATILYFAFKAHPWRLAGYLILGTTVASRVADACSI
ncbi:MAG TPA: hypothetical protein VMV94_10760 [Phycisphaerae bacterium]|nr:hypothetical protein [Phycisphaerae bacterium]